MADDLRRPSSSDLRSSIADLQSATAVLQSSTANLHSSTADLQSSLQRSERSGSSSTPDSRSHILSSALPSVPQQQQQSHADELDPSVTFTSARFDSGSSGPALHNAQSSSSTANPQSSARQPQRLAAASQLGPASGGAGSTAASGGGDAQRSRPLTQAEIGERIASRRVQPYAHRGGSVAAQPQFRDIDQHAQPAHTVGHQSEQRGMEQPEQPLDGTFLAVIHRAIASDRRSLPAVSHVSSSVRGPGQGTDLAPEPQEPQGPQLESTGPSSPASKRN